MTQQHERGVPPWALSAGDMDDEFSALAEAVPALVFMVDSDGWIMQTNRHFQDYTGLDDGARSGSTWLSWVHAQDRPVALESWTTALVEERAFKLRLRLCRADEGCCWFDCRGVPVRLDGCIDRWTFAATQVLDGNPSLPGLQGGDVWYRQVFEQAPVGLARLDARGCFLTVNDHLCRMLGCSQSQLLGSDIRRLALPLDTGNDASASGAAASFPDCMASHHGQRQWQRADGTPISVVLLVSRLPGQDSGSEQFVCAVVDVSQHVAGETEEVERGDMLECFVSGVPAAIALFDSDMRYLAWSQQYLSELSLPTDTPLLGRSHYDVLPEVPRHWRDLHARVLQGTEQCADAEPFHRPDGNTDWVRWAMRPWRRGNGTVGGAMLRFEVVTDQVLTARAQQDSLQRLRASEARFRNRAEVLLHCLEAAPFPVWAKDAQGRWLLANPAAAALLMPARPSLQGRPMDGGRPALHIERAVEERALHQGATVRVETEIFDPGSGAPRRLLVSLVPMHAGETGVDGLIGFAHDVAARPQPPETLPAFRHSHSRPDAVRADGAHRSAPAAERDGTAPPPASPEGPG